ncbi:RNA polymerase sigma factor [Sphingobacteruim zhuxiongii]|uniref:RNA polymerase sigma factor n=1 Tax=Sphingobacterium zhuxiongii TaxID=2662364 RepID=UPI00136582F8|nr:MULTISPECIES: sigma-70 family RNA polymerase sigma factor [unclassified Sphingobacterium]
MNTENDIDRILVDRLKQSDRKSFEQIYEKYAVQLYSVCYRRIQDIEISNDIIHDILLSLWENRNRKDINNLRAYLFQALRYKIIDTFQQRSKTHKLYESYLVNLQQNYIGTDHALRTKLFQELIKAEIDRLPRKMKEVFLLSREQNLTYEQIAQKLGISEQTVRSHMKHALRRLSVKLSFVIFLLFNYYFLPPKPYNLDFINRDGLSSIVFYEKEELFKSHFIR